MWKTTRQLRENDFQELLKKMKPKHEKTLKEQIEDDYAEEQRKVEQGQYAWDTYDDPALPTLDWRLWNSIKDLDITLSYVRDLLKKARRKRKRIVMPVILKIAILIGEALEFIDPNYWKTDQFLDMTTDHKKLNKALDCLMGAYSLYQTIYMDVSLNLEVPASSKAKQKGWLVTTPIILKQIRNATYACMHAWGFARLVFREFSLCGGLENEPQ